MKKRHKKEPTTSIIKMDVHDATYWQKRCEEAERKVAAYQEAFGLLIAPFAGFMQDKIEELVGAAVDEAVQELQAETTIFR